MLEADLGPSPRPRTLSQSHCGGRDGRRGRGCLQERCGEPPRVTLKWRQQWARAPHGYTSPDPGLQLQLVPATLSRSPASSSGHPPPPRPRDSRPARSPQPGRAVEFPLPRMLTPPLPHSQTLALFPESSASAPRPAPSPTPATRGRAGGSGRGHLPPCPIVPGPRPGPCGPPSGTQASPTHGSGVWERRKAESSPRGLNPLNALPGGWRARCRGLWGPSQGVIPG